MFDHLTIIELTMWPSGRVASRVCVNRLLERLMSPSQKSQVMFASAFSPIGDFFVFLAFIVFNLRPLFTCRVHMHLHAHELCGAHDRYTRAEPCDWSAGAHGVTTMLGVSLRVRWDTSNVGGVTAGQVGHK